MGEQSNITEVLVLEQGKHLPTWPRFCVRCGGANEGHSVRWYVGIGLLMNGRPGSSSSVPCCVRCAAVQSPPTAAVLFAYALPLVAAPLLLYRLEKSLAVHAWIRGILFFAILGVLAWLLAWPFTRFWRRALTYRTVTRSFDRIGWSYERTVTVLQFSNADYARAFSELNADLVVLPPPTGAAVTESGDAE